MATTVVFAPALGARASTTARGSTKVTARATAPAAKPRSLVVRARLLDARKKERAKIAVANGWIDANLAGSTTVTRARRDRRAWGRCGWTRENSSVGCARCARRVWRRARVIVGGCAHRGPSRVTRALSAVSGGCVGARAGGVRARRDG
jgi:hypothetical protein